LAPFRRVTWSLDFSHCAFTDVMAAFGFEPVSGQVGLCFPGKVISPRRRPPIPRPLRRE
jgi:hypothetical protein